MALKLDRIGSRGRTRAAWWLVALLALGALGASASWWRKVQDNARIVSADAAGLEAVAEGAAPQLRFARAQALARRGEFEAALAQYRGLHDDPSLGAAARYNSANLLMRQAAKLRDSALPGQSIPLVELAKQGYRDLLRIDPGHWEARYNYERAQRLQPDPDESDAAIAEPRNDAERAATTMRGVAPGLP
jgi:mxaK protein